MYYVHKHEVEQAYGGSEEGGWWYEVGSPVEDWNVHAHRHYNEEKAYEECRALNQKENERRDTLSCRYTDTCSYREEWFAYSVEPTPVMKPYPEFRPHYE